MDRDPLQMLNEVATLMAAANSAIKESDANVTTVSKLVYADELKKSLHREDFKGKASNAIGRYNSLHAEMNKLMDQMQEFIMKMREARPETLASDSAKFVEEFNAEITRVQNANQSQPGDE